MGSTVETLPANSFGRPASVHPAPLVGAIACVLIVGFALAIFSGGAPNPPSEAPRASEFSAERARKHVARIGRLPHPVGSAAHNGVRDYIIAELAKNGFTTQVQRATSVDPKRGAAADVENILARLDGDSHDDAVLLVAHYDSVPTGDGAADDGAGVASLLETARALKQGPKLMRDVLFLFSDGEEEGLFGARAFVAENPWAKQAGVVLNFEARGTSGPVVMFETSSPNASLVHELRVAAKHPVANSLSYEIYRRLPNETDFTVFKHAGYAGLNFAFIGHFASYHTALDNPSDLALSSLEHEGEYMLPLARALADAPRASRGSDAVYFDVLGMTLFEYSIATAYGLLAAAVLLLLFVLWKAGREQMTSGKGVAAGFAGVLLALAAGLAVSWGASLVLSFFRSSSPGLRSGLLYHSGLYVAAFSAAGLAVALLIYRWITKRAGLYGLFAGCLILWTLIAAALTFTVPGASYIFLVPVLFLLAGAAAATLWRNPNRVLVIVVASLPAILLAVPFVRGVFEAFAEGAALPVAALVVLLAGLLSVGLDAIFNLSKLRLAVLTAASALTLFAGALSVSHVSREQPSRYGLLWAMDADTGRQVWTSFDSTPRPWASLFFSNPARREALTEFFPNNLRKLLTAPAEAPVLPAPTVTILENKPGADARKLRIAVKSARRAPIFYISFDPKAPVDNLSVNGMPIKPQDGELVFYGAPPEGIELEFEVHSAQKIRLDVKDVSYGLPETAVNMHPKPPDVLPAPTFLNDSALVKKSFLL